MIFIALPEEKVQCSGMRFESPEFLLWVGLIILDLQLSHFKVIPQNVLFQIYSVGIAVLYRLLFASIDRITTELQPNKKRIRSELQHDVLYW